MSVLLPYLPLVEIQNVETSSKKMYVHANNFAVWKNCYEGYYLKKAEIPEDVKKLTDTEVNHQDYRSACKRCYLYLKTNVKEDIHPELIDYVKGAKIVILEEFLLSLTRLPEAY